MDPSFRWDDTGNLIRRINQSSLIKGDKGIIDKNKVPHSSAVGAPLPWGVTDFFPFRLVLMT